MPGVTGRTVDLPEMRFVRVNVPLVLILGGNLGQGTMAAHALLIQTRFRVI